MNKKTVSDALEKAVQLAGSQVALARIADVGEKTVWAWIHRGTKVKVVPARKIEIAFGGAVRCEDLRPDVDWAFLRSGASK